MGRTKGSRNKATLAAELQRQVDLQDEGFLNTQNNNVISKKRMRERWFILL